MQCSELLARPGQATKENRVRESLGLNWSVIMRLSHTRTYAKCVLRTSAAAPTPAPAPAPIPIPGWLDPAAPARNLRFTFAQFDRCLRIFKHRGPSRNFCHGSRLLLISRLSRSRALALALARVRVRIQVRAPANIIYIEFNNNSWAAAAVAVAAAA